LPFVGFAVEEDDLLKRQVLPSGAAKSARLGVVTTLGIGAALSVSLRVFNNTWLLEDA
jgi:hypothetical protein